MELELRTPSKSRCVATPNKINHALSTIISAVFTGCVRPCYGASRSSTSSFTLTMAGYNLIHLPKLIAAKSWAAIKRQNRSQKPDNSCEKRKLQQLAKLSRRKKID
jgi:hypothetical protein